MDWLRWSIWQPSHAKICLRNWTRCIWFGVFPWWEGNIMVVWYWKLVHFDTRLIMVIDSVIKSVGSVESQNHWWWWWFHTLPWRGGTRVYLGSWCWMLFRVTKIECLTFVRLSCCEFSVDGQNMQKRLN